MVPSRSRNTAGRKGNCSGTLHLNSGQPTSGRRLHHVSRDRGHASMVGRAAAEKTRTAVWFLLNDAGARGDGSRSERVGGTKHCHYREPNGGGNVHRTGIIADEKVALRKQRR